MALFENILAQELARGSREANALAAKKEAILSDEVNLDKYAAHHLQNIIPVAKLGKDKSKYPSLTEYINAGIPEDHPMKGMPMAIRERMREALSDPRNENFSAGDIARKVVGDSFKELGEAPYQYKREKDGSFGADEKFTKPPGYDEWLAGKRKQEDLRFGMEDDLSSPGKWLQDLTSAAGTGAAIGLVTGSAITKPAKVLTLGAAGAAYGTALGGPVGTVVGGALGALAGLATPNVEGAALGAAAGALGFAAFTVGDKIAKRLFHTTEWYRANADSPSSVDRAQALAADLGLSMAGGIAAEKQFGKVIKGLTTKANPKVVMDYVGAQQKVIDAATPGSKPTPVMKVKHGAAPTRLIDPVTTQQRFDEMLRVSTGKAKPVLNQAHADTFAAMDEATQNLVIDHATRNTGSMAESIEAINKANQEANKMNEWFTQHELDDVQAWDNATTWFGGSKKGQQGRVETTRTTEDFFKRVGVKNQEELMDNFYESVARGDAPFNIGEHMNELMKRRGSK